MVKGMFKFLSRLIKLAFLAALGTALAAKFMLKSNAEPQTQEVDLVSIFSGEELTSLADPFYGGKVLTMFGGARLDLRHVNPAPTGIYLDLAIVFGGFELVIPQGWKVNFTGQVIAGGFDDSTATDNSTDSPVVHVGGFIGFGGARVLNQSSEEIAAV